MKPLLAGLLGALLVATAGAADYGPEQIDAIYADESTGLRLYERGEYREAFMVFKDTAALGMKRSQYILGFMFMKGEGVSRSMLFGLAWLALSTESGNEEWQATYDGLYSALSDAQKSMVDDKVAEYTEKFGARSQGITCAKTSVIGSRKIDWVCRKSEGFYRVHEIELPITP